MQELFEYQKIGAEFLAKNKYALLADSCGLGKSCQAIIAAKQIKAKDVLVICPASVKYHWSHEIDKWAKSFYNYYILGDTTVTCRYGGPGSVTIVNYDLIHRKYYAQFLLSQKYDLLICDEAHYLKNPRAKRTKMVYGKRGLADIAARVWLLTGTPVLNRPVELFPMLRRFVPERLHQYADYMNFTKRYCGAYQGKFGWDDRGATNIEELAKLLDGFMLRRLKKDVMKELPEKIFQKIEFDAPSAQIKKKLKEESEEFNKGDMLGAFSTLRRETGLSKIPMVVEHLENLLEENEKIVVFAHHRDVIETLLDRLHYYKPSFLYGGLTANAKNVMVKKFVYDPDCRIFIGQIDCAGTGIDGLQNVCSTVVFAETSWVPGQIHQAIDRCHRIGQNSSSVLVQFLMLKGGIDEQIYDAVVRKEKVIGKIVDAVQKVKECKMSIEQSLERIANALEKLVPPTQIEMSAIVAEPPTPNKKVGRPAKAVVPVEKTVETISEPMFTDEPVVVVVEPDFKTPKELLVYCNRIILAMKDKDKAKKVVTAVMVAMKEAFGVATLQQLPADPCKLAEAKHIFDKIVKENG